MSMAWNTDLPQGRVRLWLVVAFFAFVYNVSLLAAPALSTGRVALIVVAALCWRPAATLARRFAREHPVALTLLSVVTAYSLLQTALTGFADTVQLSRLLNFAVMVLGGSTLFAAASGHQVRFAEYFAAATTLQAAFIGYSYVSLPYRLWLTTVVVQGGNIPLTSPMQVPGFSNSSGAALSLVQGLGVFAALFAAKHATSARRATLLVFAAAACAGSTLLTGRTGLILTVAFVPVLLLGPLVASRRLWLPLLILFVVWVGLSTPGARFLRERNPALARTVEWSTGALRLLWSDPSVRDVATQPVPPLSLETMVGTGLVVGPVGNASGNDSGYVQTYFALGLVMAAAFYSTWLGLCARRLAAARERIALGVLIALMFVTEWKEPFIFKYTYPFLVLGLLLPATPSTAATGAARR